MDTNKTNEEINALVMEGEESIMADVNEINNLIEAEKVNQRKESKSNKKSKIVESKKIPVEKVATTKVVTEVEPEKMERLHLRIVNGTIDILYRPNHNYVAFVPYDENGLAEVKRVAEMKRDEFLEYLKSSKCFSFSSRADIENIKNSSAETWYKGAWSMSTKKIFSELGIENPIEEPFYK